MGGPFKITSEEPSEELNALTPVRRIKERAKAYQLLGVFPYQVAQSPKISKFLRSVPGGLPYVLNCLRASEHPDARAFVAVYDDVRFPAFVRQLLPVEAFCIAAKLSTDRLLAATYVSVRNLGALMGGIMAAAKHAEVMETSLEEAVKPEGIMDREWNLKHMGFLPQPKGNQINVQQNVVQQSLPTEAPPAEDTIRRLADRFNEAPTLEGKETLALPAPVADPLEGLHHPDLNAMAPILSRADD